MPRPFEWLLQSTAVLIAALAIAACAQAAPLPAKAVALNRGAAEAIADGEWALAEARAALALEYNPRFTEAWVNLGLVELERGNFARAERDFVKARDLNPDLPVAHHALGVLADRRGLGPPAEACYRAALRVDPGFAPARINLARRLLQRGAIEEAKEQFLRLTQIAGESSDGWAGLAEAQLALGRTEDAQDALAEGERRLGRRPEFELLEAHLLVRAGAFDAAEDRLEPLTRYPDRTIRARALAWTAVARLGARDVKGANESAAAASELAPADPLAAYAVRVSIAAAGGDLRFVKGAATTDSRWPIGH